LAISAQLAAANKILLQKRKAAQEARRAAGLPVGVYEETATSSPHENNDVNTSHLPDRKAAVSPDQQQAETAVFDSWEIRNATQELARRRRLAGIELDRGKKENGPEPDWYARANQVRQQLETPAGDVAQGEEGTAFLPETVKAYPSVLVAIYRAGLATVGRVWKLAQAIDKGDDPDQQSGKVYLEKLRAILTDDDSPHRIFTWRRLRQIVDEGDGICWDHDKKDGRLFLYAPGRIMTILEAERLKGRPVELPTAALLDGIQKTKAHFCTSFDSGRKEENPITREKKRELTGCPESTQRTYDEITGNKIKRNFEIVGTYTPDLLHATAWQHGGAFTFVDFQGKLGRERKKYVARRLPNSYAGAHVTAAKGRQKKINRAIDLVNPRERGNGRDVDRLYYQDAAAAAKAYDRDSSHDVFYTHSTALGRTAARPSKLQGVLLWGRLSPGPH
jgi:hypothetical protein